MGEGLRGASSVVVEILMQCCVLSMLDYFSHFFVS
jgi:hypothetical protein